MPDSFRLRDAAKPWCRQCAYPRQPAVSAPVCLRLLPAFRVYCLAACQQSAETTTLKSGRPFCSGATQRADAQSCRCHRMQWGECGASQGRSWVSAHDGFTNHTQCWMHCLHTSAARFKIMFLSYTSHVQPTSNTTPASQSAQHVGSPPKVENPVLRRCGQGGQREAHESRQGRARPQ